MSFNFNFFFCSKYSHAMTSFNNAHLSGYGALRWSAETGGAPSMMNWFVNSFANRFKTLDKCTEERWSKTTKCPQKKTGKLLKDQVIKQSQKATRLLVVQIIRQLKRGRRGIEAGRPALCDHKKILQN